MLEKIKSMPLGVKLSAMFLIGFIAVLFFLNPALTAVTIATGLAIISAGILVEYWISGR